MKTVRINQEQYEQLKSYASFNEMTIQSVVEHAINKLMEKDKIDVCKEDVFEIDMFHPHAQKLADIEFNKLLNK